MFDAAQGCECTVNINTSVYYFFQNLNNAVNPVFSKPKPQPKVEKKENGVQQNGETEEHMDDSSPKAETKAEPDTKEPEAAATNQAEDTIYTSESYCYKTLSNLGFFTIVNVIY